MKRSRDMPRARAFTLIEMIMAIAIIALVISAATQLTASSLQSGRSAMQEFRAYHVAEEGIEIVRTIRDSNWLQNRGWRSGLSDGTYTIYERPVGSPWSLRSFSPAAAVGLRADDGTFQRLIEITTPVEARGSMSVRSFVKHSLRGTVRTAELLAEFTDWKKGPL